MEKPFAVELPPHTQIALELDMRRFVRAPTLGLPS